MWPRFTLPSAVVVGSCSISQPANRRRATSAFLTVVGRTDTAIWSRYCRQVAARIGAWLVMRAQRSSIGSASMASIVMTPALTDATLRFDRLSSTFVLAGEPVVGQMQIHLG